jgi:soluble lytic murein transglycosylase-like protein
MNARLLARTVPIGILVLTVISLCAVTAFNLPPRTDDAWIGGESEPMAISRIFTPQIQRWNGEIERWAADYGLDPDLVATVMQIESCGGAGAISRAGAQGLFQVMPFHFEAGEDMTAPETNARRGLAYLAQSLQKAGGDISLALAGYNGGHGVIDWEPSDWPAETQRYVYWGSGIYADAASSTGESARLREWLSAGGTRLCVLAG